MPHCGADGKDTKAPREEQKLCGQERTPVEVIDEHSVAAGVGRRRPIQALPHEEHAEEERKHVADAEHLRKDVVETCRVEDVERRACREECACERKARDAIGLCEGGSW